MFTFLAIRLKDTVGIVIIVLYVVFMFIFLGAYQAWRKRTEDRVKEIASLLESDPKLARFFDVPVRIRLSDIHGGVLLRFVQPEVKNKPTNLALAIDKVDDKLHLFPALYPYSGHVNMMLRAQRINHRLWSEFSLDISDLNKIDFHTIRPFILPIKDIYYYTNDGDQYHLSKVTQDRYDETKIRIRSSFHYSKIGALHGGLDGTNVGSQSLIGRCLIYFVVDDQLENLLLTDESYLTLKALIPEKDIQALMDTETSRYQ